MTRHILQIKTPFKGKEKQKIKDLESTWCEKYGNNYKGHVYTSCFKLQSFKAKQNNAQQINN